MAEMTKVEIITRQSKLEDLKAALNEIGINGMTVTNVLGYGVHTAISVLRTGEIGDGKIFISPVSRVIKVRTGEEDREALL